MSDLDIRPTDVAASALMVLGHARSAQDALHETIIPAMAPARRSASERLARRLRRGDVVTDDVLRDLDALVGVLDREIAAETWDGWQSDDHHVRGGWPVRDCSKRAAQLASAVPALRRLSASIGKALDAAQAIRIAETLAGE